MMQPILGSIRIDELILPVVEVRLVDNAVVITARVQGPQEPASGHARLFGEDGLPVTDGAVGSSSFITVPKVREDQTATVNWHLKIDTIRPRSKR